MRPRLKGGSSLPLAGVGLGSKVAQQPVAGFIGYDGHEGLAVESGQEAGRATTIRVHIVHPLNFHGVCSRIGGAVFPCAYRYRCMSLSVCCISSLCVQHIIPFTSINNRLATQNDHYAEH